MNSLSAVFSLMTFHLSHGGGGAPSEPRGTAPGGSLDAGDRGFWVTLGFPYHLTSVPVIDPSDIQEKAGHRGVFSRTLAVAGGQGVSTEGRRGPTRSRQRLQAAGVLVMWRCHLPCTLRDVPPTALCPLPSEALSSSSVTANLLLPQPFCRGQEDCPSPQAATFSS